MRKLAFALLFLPTLAAADIHYTLAPEPAGRSLAISIRPDKPGTADVYRIPAWCPGFYFILDYQDKISDVVATASDGTRLQIEKLDPRAWRVVNPARKQVTLSYRVLGDDQGLGFFGQNVRSDKAFVNGPGAFMYIEGRKEERANLALKLPAGWDYATGMDKAADGRLTAGDYDEFIDHPLQLGQFTRHTFKIGEYDFEAVYASVDNTFRPNLEKQTEVLKAVSEPSIKMFGNAPFKRYVYIVHLATGGFMGGLEHRASTVLAMPNTANLDLTTLAAHEFVHTWNVKHIRPKVLGPFDYTQPVRTGNLWFAEGVTDYYANITTYRSGLRDAQWLYRTLGSEIRSVQNSKSRTEVTLEDTGKRAWENGGFGFGDLSYYTKGLVVGFVLDAAIRGASNGQKSMDDVLRTLYDRHRLPKPGYDEDDLRVLINQTAGKDLTPLYNQAVRSTQEIPYEPLREIGLRVLSPDNRYDDPGFATTDSRVIRVSEAAGAAGLSVGDLVVDQQKTSDQSMEVQVRRGTEELVIKLPVQSIVSRRWEVQEDPFATPAQRARLSAWLKR